VTQLALQASYSGRGYFHGPFPETLSQVFEDFNVLFRKFCEYALQYLILSSIQPIRLFRGNGKLSARKGGFGGSKPQILEVSDVVATLLLRLL
jgi:hypothetical protein